jgi:formiminotetrahydrofolate cyclodeaminase
MLEELRPIIHPNVASDLQVGFQMLRAALQGGIANMRINLKDIKNADARVRYEDMILGWEESRQNGSPS